MNPKCPAQSGCKTDQNYEPGKLIITDPVAGKTSKGYLTYHIFIQHLQTYFFLIYRNLTQKN